MLVILLILAVGVFGFLYFNERRNNSNNNQENIGDNTQEYQEILASVRSLVDLDESEEINIARIDKPEDLILQNPSFYKDVKAGQYLIVFPTSQRVMVYDKTDNKIVNFSSYTIKVELIPEDEIEESKKPLTIELRYTSNVEQETVDEVVTTLEEASENYEIVSVSNTFNTYEKPLQVILLNRVAKPKMSQNLVAHVGSKEVVDQLPSGEENTDADAVIILTTNSAAN